VIAVVLIRALAAIVIAVAAQHSGPPRARLGAGRRGPSVARTVASRVMHARLVTFFTGAVDELRAAYKKETEVACAMATENLKAFKATWAHACKTMWFEVTALRHLEGRLLGNYASIGRDVLLTDMIYAPEARGRIDDGTRDFFLEKVEEFIGEVTLLRVVLLSAAFEVFFDGFVDGYLKARPKFFTGGARTKDGNKVAGEVQQARGIIQRIEKFFEWTGAKGRSIQPHLNALSDVYVLRNVVAHRAGICDPRAATSLKTMKHTAGERLRLSPTQLVTELAPPCIKAAEDLDKRHG
jgi:hypothetical protein